MRSKKANLFLIIALVASMCTGCGGAASTQSYDGATFDSVSSSVNSVAGFGSSTNLSNKVAGGWSDAYYAEEVARPEAEEFKEAEREDFDTGVDREDSDAEMTLVEEKLVYYCDLEIETKTYGETYDSIKTLIASYGGLVQSEIQTDKDHDWYYSNSYNNSASMRSHIACRIPSKHYNEFVEGLSNLDLENNKVVSKETSIDNISQEYYDNTAKIDALEIQEARLLEMMEQAYSIEDMITVEKRLTEVQTQLNSLKTKLVYMDMDVAYSYVNITLEEVKEYTTVPEESNFFTRLWDEIKDAWEYSGELLEELIGAILHLIPTVLFIVIPVLVLIALFIKLIIFVFKKFFNKKETLDKFKKFFIGEPYPNNNNDNK